jgi:hypothetical protein
MTFVWLWVKNHSFCMTVTETHTHKKSPPWVTSAMAFATICGSPPPVPMQCTCLPRHGLHWACSDIFFAWGGWTLSIVLPVLVKAIFFLTLVTSAIASAATLCCLSPNLAQHACLAILCAMPATCDSLDSFTAICLLAGTKISNPAAFTHRNQYQKDKKHKHNHSHNHPHHDKLLPPPAMQILYL